MIDSGTDGTVFHADISNVRIDASQGGGNFRRIGSLEGFYTEVKIVVPDFNVTYQAPGFREESPMDGLLGQATFFPLFKIRFEKANKFYSQP